MTGITFETDVEGWATSEGVDRVGNYVRRGREHGLLSDEELIAAWLVAIARLTGYVVNLKLQSANDDLMSEMKLRGIQPLEEPMARYVAACEQLQQAIKRNDPNQYQAMTDGIDAEVSEFKSGRDRSRN